MNQTQKITANAKRKGDYVGLEFLLWLPSGKLFQSLMVAGKDKVVPVLDGSWEVGQSYSSPWW